MQNNSSVIEFPSKSPAHSSNTGQVTIDRYDIFKGTRAADGKVHKIKSIGSAYRRDGLKTYTVHLKALLKDPFYLLPNNKQRSDADFVILTRELAQHSGKKYFWNNVGEGGLLGGENHGLLALSWDIFSDDFYMNLHPVSVTEVADSQRTDSAA